MQPPRSSLLPVLSLLVVLLAGCAQPPPQNQPVTDFTVPVQYHKLDNGLKVVLSPDSTAPTVAVGVYYNIGFRIEPRGRTGFAHLFEHFMFQGSRHVRKAEHLAIVQGVGGTCNATTYFDRTNYFETLPSHQVDLGLWLEADRMATLLDAMSQDNLDNQRDVVKNEKRQSYDNRPYGTFYEKLMAATFPETAGRTLEEIAPEAEVVAAAIPSGPDP